MRAEERLVDALLRAKQQDLQAIHECVRAEKDRAQRVALQHQRDVISFQAEADRLSRAPSPDGSFSERGECGVLSTLMVSAKLSPSAASPLGVTPLGKLCVSRSALALPIGSRSRQ